MLKSMPTASASMLVATESVTRLQPRVGSIAGASAPPPSAAAPQMALAPTYDSSAKANPVIPGDNQVLEMRPEIPSDDGHQRLKQAKCHPKQTPAARTRARDGCWPRWPRQRRPWQAPGRSHDGNQRHASEFRLAAHSGNALVVGVLHAVPAQQASRSGMPPLSAGRVEVAERDRGIGVRREPPGSNGFTNSMRNRFWK